MYGYTVARKTSVFRARCFESTMSALPTARKDVAFSETTRNRLHRENHTTRSVWNEVTVFATTNTRRPTTANRTKRSVWNDVGVSATTTTHRPANHTKSVWNENAWSRHRTATKLFVFDRFPPIRHRTTTARNNNGAGPCVFTSASTKTTIFNARNEEGPPGARKTRRPKGNNRTPQIGYKE